MTLATLKKLKKLKGRYYELVLSIDQRDALQHEYPERFGAHMSTAAGSATIREGRAFLVSPLPWKDNSDVMWLIVVRHR